MRRLTRLGATWLLPFIACGGVDAGEIGWHASGTGGAVAAGGADAVAAGLSMLEQGGNAADAAVATILALSITDYGAFAIGAEAPFMIYDAKKREVKVLCGLGSAPLDPEAVKWHCQNGIPAKGGMKAAPVPGAVSLCFEALKLYGTLSFERVVAPSLALLDAHEKEWHESLAATFRKLIEAERNAPGVREEKLQAARDRFYKGDIADELVAFYVQEGGFLRKADLAAHVTRVEDPVTAPYRGYTVCKCDAWTQGPYLCQTLRLLEGFDLKKMGHLSADYIHVLAEALKLGLADRDAYYGDPLFAEVPMKALLSDEYTRLRRSLIDMSKASDEIRPGDPVNMKAVKGRGAADPGLGGTTTCVVADRWGNLVAATPSGNPPYAVCPKLGVAHGNRLRCLNITPGHPNRIEPGKRPRITLTPTIVLKDGKPILAISVAGGDLQDQTTLNCLLNYLEFGMTPEDAVRAPRFSTGHHEDSFNPHPDRTEALVEPGGLTLNAGIGEEVRQDLARRGHRIKTTAGPIASPVMLAIDPNTGMMRAAGDPDAGRHAAALEGGPSDLSYDVLVYGGTSGGVIAAVQVARLGKSVLLIEPGRHLGGLSSGGLGATDIGNKAAIGGVAREFYGRIYDHYHEDGTTGTMWTFEPGVAEKVFNDMVHEAKVPVVFGERLDLEKGVETEGQRIKAVRMESGRRFRARVFIDATYEGDLMAGARVSCTVGREGNAQYNETLNGVQTGSAEHHQFANPVDPYVVPGDPSSGLLPGIHPGGPGEEGAGDRRVQAYCFRMCLTDDPDNRVPFPKPAGYDPMRYELLLRTIQAKANRRFFFTTTTMPNRKTDSNNMGPFSTDNIGMNYDYPEGDYETRRRIVEEHETYQKGMLWFLANDPRIPEEVRESVSRWGLAKDEFVDNGNWPRQIYVREARRMVSDYVMTQHNCQDKSAAPDPVGLAAYGMDSHHVQRYVDENGRARNEGDVEVGGFAPYPISFRSIVPKCSERRNLLVPVCVSATHIAFGSIRMEPVFMVLGHSAATAAVQAIEEGAEVQKIDYGTLRKRLLAEGQVLEWTAPQ